LLGTKTSCNHFAPRTISAGCGPGHEVFSKVRLGSRSKQYGNLCLSGFHLSSQLTYAARRTSKRDMFTRDPWWTLSGKTCWT